MKFIEDKELNLNEKENDLLNGKSYVETLKSLIKDAPSKGTFTIGLFGEWGSGKSSIIKTVKEEITKNNKEYGNIRFVVYDAWKYVKDSFRRMFLLNLLNGLGQEKTDLMDRFYCNKTAEQTIKLKFSPQKFFSIFPILFIISSIILTFCPYVDHPEADTFPKIWTIAAFVTFIISLLGLLVRFVFNCFSELKTSMNIPLMFAPEQFEDCFKDIISNALKKNKIKILLNWVKKDNKKNDKIVIVIDNIDRCSNDTAYELLTDIKNFMGNYDNLIFIIPIDDIALKKHLIKNNSDSDKDAEEFLRKFFNVEIRIKPLENVELYDFANNINKKYKLNFRPDTISIIANNYATNPRRIIQLCNNLTSEIDILSKSHDKKFIEENESIICKALIIREEWPAYYKAILVDNSLLKSQLSKVTKDTRLDNFLRSTFFLTQNVDISVIEKILSNTASFQDLPNYILTAISTFDIKPLLQYVELSPENKALCIKYLLDRLRKGVHRASYGTEVIKTFTALIAINKHSKLSEVDNTTIQTIIAEKNNDFISFLPSVYFPALAKYLNDLGAGNYFSKEIGLYFKTSMDNKENIPNHVLGLYKTLLTECNDINDIKEYFVHWYKESKDALSNLSLEDKITLLVTNELLEYEFEDIENMTEASWRLGDLEFISIHGNLTDKQTTSIVEKIQTNALIYSANNKQPVLNMLKNITNIIKNLRIKDIKNFQTFYNNIFKTVSTGYSQQQSLLTNISSEDDCKIVIDFLEASYIASLGNLNTSTQLKAIFDKHINTRPYIISSIMNICNTKLSIGSFKDCILNVSDISKEYLYLLGKIITEIKDEKFIIDDTVVKTKLEYLIKNIQEQKYKTLINNFFEDNIDNNRIQECFIHLISTASKETILTLSPRLQKYAFDNVCQNLDNYENEKPLLEAIASSKNKKHISALIKQIQTHLINHLDVEFWKALYEKIDKTSVAPKDKEIMQSIFSKEVDETEDIKETA